MDLAGSAGFSAKLPQERAVVTSPSPREALGGTPSLKMTAVVIIEAPVKLRSGIRMLFRSQSTSLPASKMGTPLWRLEGKPARRRAGATSARLSFLRSAARERWRP